MCSTAPIYSVDIHPETQIVATGDGDNFIKFYKVVDGEFAPFFSIPQEVAINCVKFSRNNYLVSGDDNGLIVFWEERKKNQWTNRLKNWDCSHGSPVLDISFGNKYDIFASCGIDTRIIIWDTLTLDRLQTLTQHDGPVKGISFHPEDEFLISQSDCKKNPLIVWKKDDTTDNQHIHFVFHQKIIKNFQKSSSKTFFKRPSFCKDGRFIAAATTTKKNHAATMFEYLNGVFVESITFSGHKEAVSVATFSPLLYSKKESKNSNLNHTFICIGSKDTKITLWDTNKLKPIKILKNTVKETIHDITFTKDGKNLIYCSGDGKLIFKNIEKYLNDQSLEENSIKSFQDINKLNIIQNQKINYPTIKKRKIQDNYESNQKKQKL